MNCCETYRWGSLGWASPLRSGGCLGETGCIHLDFQLGSATSYFDFKFIYNYLDQSGGF
jgi:hypothetical protein